MNDAIFKRMLWDCLCLLVLAFPLILAQDAPAGLSIWSVLTFMEVIGLIVLSGFKAPGLYGSIFLFLLLFVYMVGLGKSMVGMEVGKWGPEQWFGGVFWHSSPTHLLINIAHAMIPLATLAILSLRWYDTALVLICSVLGYVLGVQFLGTPGQIHAGASGVVCGFMAASIVSLLRFRFAWELIPLYLYGIWTGIGLVSWCLPGQAGGHTSWEGHLGGAIGGVVSVILIGLVHGGVRRQRLTPMNQDRRTDFSRWAETQGPYRVQNQSPETLPPASRR